LQRKEKVLQFDDDEPYGDGDCDYFADPPPPLPCGRVRKYSARLSVLAMGHSLNLYQWYGAYQYRHGQHGDVGLNFLDALVWTLFDYSYRYLCTSSRWDYSDAKNGRGKYRG
jgi:hypothetical protein